MAIDLRTFAFVDNLQPQLTAFMCTGSRGYLPLTYDASIWVEVAPGIAINRITDIACKKTQCRPAVQVVERSFGLLEVHHESQAEAQEAGRQILDQLGLKQSDRLRPRIETSEIITHVTDYQLMLINRMRYGSMFLHGQTLYILEVHPAGYAAIAANEAEKAAPVTLVEVQPFGAFGRMYLAGTEANIEEAARAVQKCLDGIDGRENKGGGRG